MASKPIYLCTRDRTLSSSVVSLIAWQRVRFQKEPVPRRHLYLKSTPRKGTPQARVSAQQPTAMSCGREMGEYLLLRCLKRYIARETYCALLLDAGAGGSLG
jgi:hypothetical protein